MVYHKALAMDNLNSSSIILPRASSHLQHQPNRQQRRNNSLRMRRLLKDVLCHVIKPNDLSMFFCFAFRGVYPKTQSEIWFKYNISLNAR